MTKAILLLSGGLDSTLAGKLLLELGVEVDALSFTSPFCNCTPGGMGCSAAKSAADQIGIKVKSIACGQDYLEAMKKPRFGRGSGVNACLDCRIHMFRHARKVMEETGADFVATGEVLGERPMSQRRDAIERIESESGLTGKILRPLSAKLFPPTDAENSGLVDREQLLDIQGRRRQPQFELAERLGVKDYLCPAGGCLLTDKEFAARFRDLLQYRPTFDVQDAILLRYGRHFRLPGGAKVVVGRNEDENSRFHGLRRDADLILIPHKVPGPTVILQDSVDRGELLLAAQLLASHCKVSVDLMSVEAEVPEQSDALIMERVTPLPRDKMDKFRVCAAVKTPKGSTYVKNL